MLNHSNTCQYCNRVKTLNLLPVLKRKRIYTICCRDLTREKCIKKKLGSILDP